MDGKVTTLTNSYTDEETEVTVIKVWDDNNNNDRKRPEILTVDLMNSETKVTTVTLNEANGWTAKVEHLPKLKDGVEIVYTWSENEAGLPEGYALTDTSVDGKVTTLTNSNTD